MKTLLIASRNVHKLAEIRAILGGSVCHLTLNDFCGAPDVIEDADTFAGNATKKAVELSEWLATVRDSRFTIHDSQILVLADDSGLEVDALNGAPGVYSARFAALDSDKEGNSPDADNNSKLLRLLKDVPIEERSAQFHCVLALVEVSSPKSKAQSPQLFDGLCKGRIEFAPRGRNGFGYDPLFVPNGFNQTFAELGEDVKNKLSHRARALEKLENHFQKLT